MLMLMEWMVYIGGSGFIIIYLHVSPVQIYLGARDVVLW